MINTYDETFTLRPRDCDLSEQWRPSAILETMQDTAGAHSISGNGMGPAVTNGRAAAKGILDSIESQTKDNRLVSGYMKLADMINGRRGAEK